MTHSLVEKILSWRIILFALDLISRFTAPELIVTSSDCQTLSIDPKKITSNIFGVSHSDFKI